MSDVKGSLNDRLKTRRLVNLKLKKLKEEEVLEALEISKRKDAAKKLPINSSFVDFSKTSSDIDFKLIKEIEVVTPKTKFVLKDDKKRKPCIYTTEKNFNKIKEVLSAEVEKHEMKKEVKKQVLKFGEKSKERIDEVKVEIADIITKANLTKKTEDFKELIEKLEKLKDELVEITLTYVKLKEKKVFDNLSELNEVLTEKISNDLENIKGKIDDIVYIEDLATECFDEITKFEALHDVEKISKNVIKETEKGKKIKENYEKRDVEFDRLDKKVFKASIESEFIVDEIDEKFKEITEQAKKVKNFKVDLKKAESLTLLNVASLSLARLVFRLSSRKSHNLRRQMFINNSLRAIRNSFIENNKKQVYLQYKNMNKTLKEEEDKLEAISSIVSDSIKQVVKIRKEFEEKFLFYEKYFPSYKEVKTKLNNIEANLKMKNKQISKSKKQVVEFTEKNDKIIKLS